MQSIRHTLQSFVFLLLMVFAVHASAVPTGPVIGNVSLVLGTVQGVDQDGDVFEVSRGADLYAGYTLTTGSRGMVRATMNDGTTLTLGRDSDATLDNFEFDATSGAGGFDATVRRGGFEYVSGDLGKFALNRQHSSISTPAGVIGVRGTIIKAIIDMDANTITISVPSGNVSWLPTKSTLRYEMGDDGDFSIIIADQDGNVVPQTELPKSLQDAITELNQAIQEAEENRYIFGDSVPTAIKVYESDDAGGQGDLELDEDGTLRPVSPTDGSPQS